MPANGSAGWFNLALVLLFFLGGCFYLLRLLSPTLSRKIYNRYDWDGEIGHGLCMFAMFAAFSPVRVFSHELWGAILEAGALWFLARALTWGRKLPWNVWWYDWAHVAMLSGMGLMFLSVSHQALTIFFTLFWGWFSCYYVYESIHDARGNPTALDQAERRLKKTFYLGSDLAHLSMGVCMLVMMLAPGLLMPAHSFHHSVGETEAKVAQLAVPELTVVDDSNFNTEVLQAKLPVFVLVYGGCDACLAQLDIFRQMTDVCGSKKAKFVRLNKDESPRACHDLLNVSECPAVLTVVNGQVRKDRLGESATPRSLLAYFEQQLQSN
jgi:hypothetical protein